MANFLKSLFVKGIEIDTTGASSGNVLSYNGTKFAPATPGVGSLALDDLSDVTIASPVSGDFIKYNGSLWVADAIDLGTDTTGNYMSGISGTSPVSVSHTPSEGSSATVSLDSAYGDTLNPYGSKTANYFLASPNGSAGTPSFRAIVAADIPTLNQNTTGTASNITASSNTTLTSLANLVTVGTITSGTWSGSFGAVSGANLTSLNASNISSGTIASARVAGSYTGITGVGTITTGTWSGSFGAVSGANLTSLNASNLGSGTVPSARVSGSYTGITSVGTLGSLTVDGVSSPQLDLGDWSGNGAYSGLKGTSGYVLLGHATDTGIYLRTSGAGLVYIGGNNTDQLIVSQTQSAFSAGSALAPSITLQGDTNTGLYSGTADWLHVACGGSQMVTFTTSGPFFGTNTTTSSVTWRVDTFNRLGTPSSTRELKENIEDLAGEQALSIVRALRPRTFTWKPQPDDGEFLSSLKQGAVQAGFIVEEIEETTLPFSMLEYKPNISDSMTEDEKIEAATNLASYIPYYWKESHLIAILASAVKSLDARLAVLESTQ